jgi:hypothetical protein
MDGANYTDFVSRVRLEKAKNLLLNPQYRISEIAFEVGQGACRQPQPRQAATSVWGEHPIDAVGVLITVEA